MPGSAASTAATPAGETPAEETPAEETRRGLRASGLTQADAHGRAIVRRFKSEATGSRRPAEEVPGSAASTPGTPAEGCRPRRRRQRRGRPRRCRRTRCRPRRACAPPAAAWAPPCALDRADILSRGVRGASELPELSTLPIVFGAGGRRGEAPPRALDSAHNFSERPRVHRPRVRVRGDLPGALDWADIFSRRPRVRRSRRSTRSHGATEPRSHGAVGATEPRSHGATEPRSSPFIALRSGLPRRGRLRPPLIRRTISRGVASRRSRRVAPRRIFGVGRQHLLGGPIWARAEESSGASCGPCWRRRDRWQRWDQWQQWDQWRRWQRRWRPPRRPTTCPSLAAAWPRASGSSSMGWAAAWGGAEGIGRQGRGQAWAAGVFAFSASGSCDLPGGSGASEFAGVPELSGDPGGSLFGSGSAGDADRSFLGSGRPYSSAGGGSGPGGSWAGHEGVLGAGGSPAEQGGGTVWAGDRGPVPLSDSLHPS